MDCLNSILKLRNDGFEEGSDFKRFEVIDLRAGFESTEIQQPFDETAEAFRFTSEYAVCLKTLNLGGQAVHR